MSGYASGKYAYGLCDYCGQRYPYSDLKKNWKGFKVCPEDYEPKEPQEDPSHYRGDAIALFEPRPDQQEVLEVRLQAPGDSFFSSNGMAPSKIAENFSAVGGVGQVTVTT